MKHIIAFTWVMKQNMPSAPVTLLFRLHPQF